MRRAAGDGEGLGGERGGGGIDEEEQGGERDGDGEREVGWKGRGGWGE